MKKDKKLDLDDFYNSEIGKAILENRCGIPFYDFFIVEVKKIKRGKKAYIKMIEAEIKHYNSMDWQCDESVSWDYHFYVKDGLIEIEKIIKSIKQKLSNKF